VPNKVAISLMIRTTALLLLFLSCARQIAPSGGPDDKTPPNVRYTVPSIGTVRYPAKGAITFNFSEWVDKKSAEKCLSVFPLPSRGIKVKVSGKSITVQPVQAFAESTTYHIEIGTSLLDLHGNSIGTPYHFFFSTGSSIDSGKVYGCVFSADGAPIQTKVALFAAHGGVFPDSAYFSLPSYLVQADSSGIFTLDHIRKGAYELISFIDANNDNRLQPGMEQAFAPVEKNIIIDSAVGPEVLYPVASDTITNRIISITPVSNLVIMGTWARPPDTGAARLLSQWRLQSLDTAGARRRLKAYVPLPRTSRFLLTLSDTMSVAGYRLWYAAPLRVLHGKNSLLRDSIRFAGIRGSDTVRPAATGFFPQGPADLKPRLKLAWSKPVAFAKASWIMVDSLGDSVAITMDTAFAETTFCSVRRALKPGARYRLRLPDTLFSDISGNHPRDSTLGKYTVQTIAAENLCYSLSGGVQCSQKTDSLTWLFKPLNAVDCYVSKNNGGRFRFDSLPGGKGRIGRLVDFNGDGRPTPGGLVPWTKPEPYRLFPDTVEARARWDIEGIEIPACEPCEKKKIPAASPADAQQPAPKKSNPLQSIK